MMDEHLEEEKALIRNIAPEFIQLHNDVKAFGQRLLHETLSEQQRRLLLNESNLLHDQQRAIGCRIQDALVRNPRLHRWFADELPEVESAYEEWADATVKAVRAIFDETYDESDQ